MSLTPALISAGIGLLGDVLGSRRSDNNVGKVNNTINEAYRRALALYEQTNLGSLDDSAVATYADAVRNETARALNQADALAIAQGSPRAKLDTSKQRSMDHVAAEGAGDIGRFAANLQTTRPARQMALLPTTGMAGAGLESAAYMDARAQSQNQAQTQGLMDIARLVADQVAGQSASRDATNAARRAYGAAQVPYRFPTTLPRANLGYQPGPNPFSDLYGGLR